MEFKVIPIPESLKTHVECIRIARYAGDEKIAINVCLNGLPGIVFQHHDGRSPLENITTRAGMATAIPTLFVYGQMMHPGVMHYQKASFTTTQVILKPNALQTLLGLNASVLTNAVVDLAEFSAGSLNLQLLEARDEKEHLAYLIHYLEAKSQAAKTRDCLIEESLRLIHHSAGAITVKALLECLNISERQFEKRFQQAVGLSPHFYIRIKRFNAALRLMQSGQFSTLTALAHRLHFYDQSHFIRDIKTFSGITPGYLLHKVGDIPLDQRVYAYTEAVSF
jgi:AraC-like DNA-binding protein